MQEDSTPPWTLDFFCMTRSCVGLLSNTAVTVKANSHIPYRAPAVPRPCRVAKGLDCLSHLIYTVRSCLIHTYRAHAVLRPCCFRKRRLKATAQRGMGTAWHVWINIGCRKAACGRPAQVRLLTATTRSSTKVVIGISNTPGQCETKRRLSWTRRSWLFWCKNMSVV